MLDLNANESIADLYGTVGTEFYREFLSKEEENIHRYLYEIDDPTKEFETLENYEKQTKLLFELIKS